MESYFCKADCDTCQNTADEKSICMQARIISDLCEEEGLTFAEGIKRYAKAFRENLWEMGINDQHELATALRNSSRRTYQVINFPYGPSKASFFPAEVLERF